MLTPTKAEAGHRYLTIMCPANAAIETFSQAVDSKNLQKIQNAARDLSAAERTAVKKLTDTAIRWPSSVSREDVASMADHYYRDLSWLSAVINAQSHADLPGPRPGGDNFGEASQRIRAALDLPSDTSEGCAGLGDA